MIERWAPVIPGVYEVSDRGNARSLDHVIVERSGRHRRHKGRQLKVSVVRGGSKRPSKKYRFVNIRGRSRKVSVLMLEAFVGPRPFPKAYARHLNDESLDDRLENLEWGTAQQSADDRERNGHTAHQKGELQGRAKLTERDVLAIRSAHATGGVSYRELAERYGVSESAIGQLVRRETWRHV